MTESEYLPGSQASQDPVEKSQVKMNPGAHMQRVLPGRDDDVAGHVMHALEPVVGEYVPAPQSEHQEDEVAPTVAEALPAAHAVHSVAAVALENLPAEQTMHSALPDASEYAPAPQSEHEEDEVENFPAGHSMHAADDDAPRTVENLPGGHDVQELTGMPYAFQRAVKPMRATDASDVKVTFTRPVTRIDEFSELKDPECCIILLEEW